jgi:cytochrome P450
MQILGYDLEPGTILLPSIYLAHHRPQVYPEPKRFRPERFLERQFSPYEYLPFGGGDRRCIGAAFALYELKLVLFHLLTHRQFKLRYQKPLKPIRRGLTLAPSNQFQLIVKDDGYQLKSGQIEWGRSQKPEVRSQKLEARSKGNSDS